jgi:acyl transferase domain-containing protein/NADPH:quinone reductase-like Zn-dependent oxidoreductase
VIANVKTEELQRDEKTSRLTEPEFSQPACTALQIALVVLLRYWNIRPAAVIGHSSGEIAAAFCAGILSHQDAVKVGYYRGVLSAELAADMSRRQETMMAVALSQQDVEGYIAHVVNSAMLSIACVNSPSNVTVSGDAEAIEALRCSLEKDGVFARKLNVDVAYHSPTMNCVSEKYLKLMGNLKKRRETFEEHSPPQMVSSVSGELVSTDEAACGQYWVDNMVSRVEFAQALSTLQHSNTIPAVHSVIEIGPTGALRRPILDTLTGVSYDSVLKTGRSAQETAMSLCGNLWCYGVPVKLNAVNNLIESEVTMLTDLPTYPFNHAHSFWYESRLSKNFRFRKQPRHELLGTPVIDWNPLEAKWRNVIDATSSPWIRDHGFNGSRLYPAAGMIIMAIEASRQLADDVRATIKGYRVKDITFSRALVIPDDQDILETEFYMRSREGDRSQWSEFRLCSLNNNEWVEHCRGTIIVECEQNDVEVDNGLEMNQLRQRLLENSARVARNCNVQVGSKQMYHNLGTFGFDFGPTFQTLHDVSFNKGGEATATIHLNAWRDKVPPRTARIQEHIIHPTDLDGLLHLTVTAISRGGWKPIPTMVPTYLHELWISNEFLLDPKIKSMVISSRSMSKGLREAEFEMIACDPSRNQVLISIDRYRATAISSLGVLSKATPWRRLCFRPQWKMDIDTAGHEVVSRYCNDMADAVVASLGDAVQEAEFACLFFMSNVLLDGNTLDGVPSDSHLRKYCNWMRQHLSRADTQALWQSPDMQRLCGDGEYRQSFMSRVKESGPEGEVYAAVGKQLSSIMRGEIDVLDMLFKDNLLQNFYSGDAFTANYERMRAYTELLAHKNPNMRVLEIGAGTGGATEGILRALAPPEPSDKNSTPRYHEYVYTDISAGFFENAKTRFDQHAARLSFQTLDIEKDPMKQGFESAKYDLIVASCVLHATSEIDTTLKHTRSLLKPGGKLLLFEPCRLECARIPFVFGLLPGWWLSKESNREWSPLLSDTAWHDALLRNGFSGTEICLRDGEDDRHTFSVMVSSATSTPTTDLSLRAQVHTPIITINPDSLQQVIIADRLSDILGARGWPEPTVVPFTDLKHLELDSAICISLLEIDEPFLHRINEEEFLVLQRIVPSLSLMLWVSNERSRLSRDPLMGIATGFGRSMCSEHETMNFVTLLIEDDLSSQMIGDNIYTILQASAEMSCEQEYRYVDGQIQINRIVETNKINDNVHYRTVVQEPELRPFGQEPRRALTLTTSSPGLLSSLQFIDDPEQRSLGSEEVEIEVKAVGINFKNVMVALGQIPDTSLGQECSGIVTRLGSGILADRLRVNDRVCCLTKDGFKTFARCHISSLYKLPSDMSFATAAAIPVAFCTAYYSLIYLARLMPDESVLIHAAAGGVGQAAIQIAQSKGAEIFATVGSDEKKALLMDLYAIPEDHIFSSRHVSFEKGVKRMTSGRGVDVVLNSLSGELLKLSVDCVAPLGRFVEIGKKDMYLRNDISMTPFLNNIAFFSVDLGIIAEKAKPLMQEIMTSAMRLYTDESGYMQPPQPLTKFAVSHVEEAFRSLQSGKNSGKAIVELGMDDIVPVIYVLPVVSTTQLTQHPETDCSEFQSVLVFRARCNLCCRWRYWRFRAKYRSMDGNKGSEESHPSFQIRYKRESG